MAPGRGIRIKIRSRLINFPIPTSCMHGGRTMSAIPICGPCRKMSDDTGAVVVHTPELISKIFDEEVEKLLANPGRDLGSHETVREARRISEAMIKAEEFDPV